MVALSLLPAIGLLTGTAKADVKTVKVDCGKGQTIAKALEEGDKGKPLIVVVKGTCNENVVITRDDVTLQEDPAAGGAVTGADPAQPAIQIDGARRVVMDNLTVSGGSDGIFVGRGSNASIGIGSLSVVGPNTIRGNTGNGINVYQSSQARIHGNLIETHSGSGVRVKGSAATITANTIRGGRYGIGVWNSGSARIGLTDRHTSAGNLIDQNKLDGVQLTAGSSAWMYGNTIQNNANWGILASENSVVRMVGLNTVTSKGGGGSGGGIQVHDSSTLTSLKGDFTITPNNSDVSNNSGMAGILAADNSSLDLRDGMTVTNNSGPGIFLLHGSRLRVQETTVSGNTGNAIQLTYASSVRFRTPASTIVGSIVCDDGESSIAGISLPPGCTGF